jgi:carbon-monoxide dehydrogenase medium subunit
MRFDYLEPTTIEEALTLLTKNNGKAKVIAGGTDVMLQARNRAIKPEYLVDITNIPGLEYITLDGQGLRIGALATIRALETSPELKKSYPIIPQAAGRLGSVAIRNVATLGGNLCNALPSAETAQAMVALQAQAKITGPSGTRELPIVDFFKGVGKTVLKPNELLVEIKVPKPPPNTFGVYIKHSPRGTIDLAIVNITVLITFEADERTCKDASIVLGAVAPTPLKAGKAENILKSQKIDEKLIGQAAQLAAEEAHPRADSIRGSA